MDRAEIVSSFGRFMKKQNLCEESAWSTFMNHVEEHSKTTEEGEDTESDLRQLIQELNGLLPSYNTESETIPGDQLRCVGELVVKTEPQEEVESMEEGTQPMEEESTASPKTKEAEEEEEEKKEEEEEKEEEKGPAIDPSLVQITASKAEIDRRVAAFQEHTRLEVNEGNIREFRSAVSSGEASESSARTDATFLRRPNSKSRVQVSRVVNQYGPQTRCPPAPPGGDLGTGPGSGSVSDSVEERLCNMEQHVGVGTGDNPKDPRSRGNHVNRVITRGTRHRSLPHQPHTAHPVRYPQQQEGSCGRSVGKGLDSCGMPAVSAEGVACQYAIRHQQPLTYQLEGPCGASPMFSYQRPVYPSDKAPPSTHTAGASTSMHRTKAMAADSCLDGAITSGRRQSTVGKSPHRLRGVEALSKITMYTDTSLDRVTTVKSVRRVKEFRRDQRVVKDSGVPLETRGCADDSGREEGKLTTRDSSESPIIVTDFGREGKSSEGDNPNRHRVVTENKRGKMYTGNTFNRPEVLENLGNRSDILPAPSDSVVDKSLEKDNHNKGRKRFTPTRKELKRRHSGNPVPQGHAVIASEALANTKRETSSSALVFCGMVFKRTEGGSAYKLTNQQGKAILKRSLAPTNSQLTDSKKLSEMADKTKVTSSKVMKCPGEKTGETVVKAIYDNSEPHLAFYSLEETTENQASTRLSDNIHGHMKVGKGNLTRRHGGNPETHRHTDETAIPSYPFVSVKKGSSVIHFCGMAFRKGEGGSAYELANGRGKSAPGHVLLKDSTPVNSNNKLNAGVPSSKMAVSRGKMTVEEVCSVVEGNDDNSEPDLAFDDPEATTKYQSSTTMVCDNIHGLVKVDKKKAEGTDDIDSKRRSPTDQNDDISGHHNDETTIGVMLQELWPEDDAGDISCPQSEHLKSGDGNVIFNSDGVSDAVRIVVPHEDRSWRMSILDYSGTSSDDESWRMSNEESVTSSEDESAMSSKDESAMSIKDGSAMSIKDGSAMSSKDESAMSSNDEFVTSSSEEWLMSSNYESMMSSEYETVTSHGREIGHTLLQSAKSTHCKTKNAKSAIQQKKPRKINVLHNQSAIPLNSKDRRTQREIGSFQKRSGDLSNVSVVINTKRVSNPSRSSVRRDNRLQSGLVHRVPSSMYVSSSEEDGEDSFVTLSSSASKAKRPKWQQ